MGSVEHPLLTLSVEGSLRADGESVETTSRRKHSHIGSSSEGPGGGSGGTILLFLNELALGDSAILSSIGGYGSPHGGGGGGGGRIHFHWSDIPAGDVYQPIASMKGSINAGFVSCIIYLYADYLSRTLDETNIFCDAHDFE